MKKFSLYFIFCFVFLGVLTSVPTIKIKSVQQSNGRDPAMLVCTAYNFYPKKILVTWLRNDQEVMSGVSCSDVLPDGNWYYQVHSYLEYIPSPPEKITCMVEHLSLSEPVLHVWGRCSTMMHILHKKSV